jgi:hypothetical protein
LIHEAFVAAVLTYKINKKDVGMIMKSAVAISPRILTSMIKK